MHKVLRFCQKKPINDLDKMIKKLSIFFKILFMLNQNNDKHIHHIWSLAWSTIAALLCVCSYNSWKILKLLVMKACCSELHLASLLLTRQMAQYHFLNCKKVGFFCIEWLYGSMHSRTAHPQYIVDVIQKLWGTLLQIVCTVHWCTGHNVLLCGLVRDKVYFI